MLIATEDDVNLEAMLASNPTQLAECERQYRVKVVEFCRFCKVPWDPTTAQLAPVDIFTDDRLAKFLGALLQQYGPSDSRRKTTLAALNDMMKKLGKRNLYDTEHYPKLHVILQVNDWCNYFAYVLFYYLYLCSNGVHNKKSILLLLSTVKVIHQLL